MSGTLAILAAQGAAGSSGPTRTQVGTSTFTGTSGNALTDFTNNTPSTAIAKYTATANHWNVPYGNMNISVVSSGSYNNDQYAVQPVIVGTPGTGDCIGVALRVSADTDAGRDGYLIYYRDSAPRALVIDKVVNGTTTNLSVDTSHTWVDGDTVEGEVQGTTLRGLINGAVVITLTSQTDLTTGKPGICGTQASGSTAEGTQTWRAGNLT